MMEDCSTDERLQQETVNALYRRQWTDEYVEHAEKLMRQNVVVIWLQCLLVDLVRHAGTLAQDHVDICTPKQRPCNDLKLAEQWADDADWVKQCMSTEPVGTKHSGHWIKTCWDCDIGTGKFWVGNLRAQG